MENSKEIINKSKTKPTYFVFNSTNKITEPTLIKQYKILKRTLHNS